MIPILALLPLLAARKRVQDRPMGQPWSAACPAWAEALVVVGAVAAIIVAGRF